jgi:hypothetical protein
VAFGARFHPVLLTSNGGEVRGDAEVENESSNAPWYYETCLRTRTRRRRREDCKKEGEG